VQEPANSLLLWQLADSAFPSGGFTHSSGLEASSHYGAVRTAGEVRRLAVSAVWQAGYGALPFVSASHHDASALPELDAQADLFLNQPVSNRASRAQGRTLLNSAARVFPEAPLAPLGAMASHERFCGHHAPIFGAVMGALDVDDVTAARLFLYQTARSVMSAAIRIGVIGTFEAQRLQFGMAEDIDRTLRACHDLAPSDAAQIAPILDLYQSTQDRLYSRLFQS
jgi:urease accessory protein